MGGKMSRDKGGRVERLLVHYLRALGWDALRIPLSGASKGYKGDVIADKSGRKVLFEVKARKDAFKKIYELYREARRVSQDDVLSLAIPGARHLCISVADSLDAVFTGAEIHTLVHKHPLYERYKRTFDKIIGLEKYLGEANVLAIKDNGEPFLFVRYL